MASRKNWRKRNEIRDCTGLLARLLDGQRVSSTTHHTHHRATMNDEDLTLISVLRELRWQRAAVMLLAKKVGEDPGELFKAADMLLNGEAEID